MDDSFHRPFTKPLKRLLNQATIWLLLSLAIALLYRLPSLQNAFSADFVVQDDARQHVFWMQRFIDPDLFPDDLLADYFQSVAPWGYATLYRMAAALGLDPWTFNKILPVFIALTATLFVFGTVMELVQVPLAAFVSAMFLNQIFPLRDDIVSATPAAFFHPFFLAFLYFTLKRLWLPCACSIILMGLFYPQGVLVIGITLLLIGVSLLRWKPGKLYLSGTQADYWLLGSGLAAAFLVLLPYALRDSVYGPVLSLDQARDMFALSSRGWSKFFDDDAVDFWLFGKRTGIFPMEWSRIDLKVQPQIWLTFAIPFLIAFPGKSRLAKTAAPRILLLLQVVIASISCYFLAHLFLFELHLPNRYTEHSLRAIAALGSGVATALIMDRVRSSSFQKARKPVLLGLLGIWAIAPLMISLLAEESRDNYVHGQFPGLYEYLQSQPKDTVVASLDEEINNISSFTNRSIFVGAGGWTLPYHLGYYDEVRQRSIDLIDAQYSFDVQDVKAFLDKHPIDYWLITPEMFTQDWVDHDPWLLQYSEDTNSPHEAINTSHLPVIWAEADVCTVAKFQPFLVLDADCLRSK